MSDPSSPSTDTLQNQPAPIKVALIGFKDEAELAKVTALFTHASRWQQPWVVIPHSKAADLLLIAAETPAEVLQLQRLHKGFSKDRLIAYSESVIADARWHLQRQSDQTVSPLAFSLLIKEISHAWDDIKNSAKKKDENDITPSVKSWQAQMKALSAPINRVIEALTKKAP
ncbi:hypothetical protein JCM14076_08950 [Methylosoma difficile]